MTMSYRRGSRLLGRGALFSVLALAAGGCTTAGSSHDAPLGASPPGVKVAATPVVIEPQPGTVRLPRAEHPLARPELDQGRLDPSKRIRNLSLVFRLSPEQERDEKALAVAQLDPASPLFHKWLVPETYRARFGARDADVARATAWLAAQGLEVHRTSRLGRRVTFSATAGALEKAFQTEMHRYLVAGKEHYAMATAPALPADLASVVLGIRNTHDFNPRPIVEKQVAAAIGHATPMPPHANTKIPIARTDAALEVLAPADWATAYDVTRLYDPGIGGKQLDGKGVTIGIVGTASIGQTDIDAFRQTFNLPQRNVGMILVPDTGPAADGQGGAGIEAILDVEWSGGIAKGADVNYVFIGSEDGNVDDATIYLIEENLGSVMSESYGGCELGIPPADADILEQFGTAANIMGITYMAASGDSGADTCIDFGIVGIYAGTPGDYPGVTSVGGTEFPHPKWDCNGNLLAYPNETVWNEASNPFLTVMFGGNTYPLGVGAGGGGISAIFDRPAYQADVPACKIIGSLPVPSSRPMRQTPDIAVSAASGTPGYFVECNLDTMTQDCSSKPGISTALPIGGTSASSPSFTGLVAILNQAVGGRLGNINPMLYQLAANHDTASAFHDITEGSNAIICGAAGNDASAPTGGYPDAGCAASGIQGYNAAPGYDCATGLGSIDGYNLVSAWLGGTATHTTIVPSPTTATDGQEVTLTATIGVDGTSTKPVTGDITFAFKTYDQTGEYNQSWELGTVAIKDGTTTTGSATLKTIVPVGLLVPGHQTASVVAVYGGDPAHFASVASPATLTYGAITFAVVPPTATVAPKGTQPFTTTGGVAPVTWTINIDTTATFSMDGGYQGSTLGDAGAFVAGPKAGFVELAAIDNGGAQALAYVTVGSPTGTAPWIGDAGFFVPPPPLFDAALIDAGVTDTGAPCVPHTGHDAGMAATSSAASTGHDAGRPDTGVDAGAVVTTTSTSTGSPRDAAADHHVDGGDEASGNGGCGCELGPRSGSTRGSLPAGASGVLLALGLVLRRRRASVARG